MVIDSSAGKQPSTAVYKVEGSTITGHQSSPKGSMDVSGTVNGNHATWSGKAYVPFPITLQFDVTLNGDSFAGTVVMGPFGTSPVTGTRK